MSMHPLITPVCNVSPAGCGTLTATQTTGNSGSQESVEWAYQNYSYIASPAAGYRLDHIEISGVYVDEYIDRRIPYSRTRDVGFETSATDDDFVDEAALYPWALYSDTEAWHYSSYIESLTITAYFVPRNTGLLVYDPARSGSLVYGPDGRLVYDGDFPPAS